MMGLRSRFILAIVALMLAGCTVLQPVPPSFLTTLRERGAEFEMVSAPPDVMSVSAATAMADERHKADAGASGAQPAPSLVYGLVRCVELPRCRMRSRFPEAPTIQVWLVIYPDCYWVASDARTGLPVINSTSGDGYVYAPASLRHPSGT